MKEEYLDLYIKYEIVLKLQGKKKINIILEKK